MLTPFRRHADFRGRSRRRAYWRLTPFVPIPCRCRWSGGLIALLLGVPLLVWYLMSGRAGSNRFGAGPKVRGVATAYGRDRGPADHPPPCGQQPPASLIPMVAGSGPLRA